MKSRDEIIKILETEPDKKRVVEFAWRCAVRALPYLGAKGNFDFWEEQDRKKHLYSVFIALDVACGYSKNMSIDVKNYRAAAAAAAAAYAAAAAAAAYAAAYAAYADAADAAAAYAAAAAAAAYAADADADAAAAAAAAADAADADADAAAYAAAYAAYAADAAAAYAAYADADADADAADDAINKAIDKDLESIKDKAPFASLGGIEVYGEEWNNFRAALEDEKIGCGYWADLYEDILNDKIDIEKLEQRLAVPEKKQQEGATEVAVYLKKVERAAPIKTIKLELENEWKEKIAAVDAALKKIEAIKTNAETTAKELETNTNTHKKEVEKKYEEIEIESEKISKTLEELDKKKVTALKYTFAGTYSYEADKEEKAYNSSLNKGFVALGCAVGVVIAEIYLLLFNETTETTNKLLVTVGEHPFLLIPIFSLTLLLVGISIVLFRESARHYRRFVFYKDIAIKTFSLRTQLQNVLGIKDDSVDGKAQKELTGEHMVFAKELLKGYLSTIYSDDTKDIDVQQVLALTDRAKGVIDPKGKG